MNIFILDEKPKKCAELYCDKHIVKMIVESCQMLANAFSFEELKEAPKTQKGNFRKHSYLHHPCSKWVLERYWNWEWLLELVRNLCWEYKYRYNKNHFCLHFVNWCSNHRDYVYYSIDNQDNLGLTSFVLAMPEEYKTNNPVESYKAYYKGEKKSFAKWTKRPVPEFMK